MIPLDARGDLGDDDSIVTRDQQRRRGLVERLTLALTGIHCLFLMGVMVASSNLLLRGWDDDDLRVDQSLWRWSTLGWIAAAAVWIVVFVLGFVML
jgi:hypothetical protein